MQGLRKVVANFKHDDSRNLTLYLQEEKDVIKAYNALIKEKKEASKYYAIWGKLEGADIDDISSKMTTVFDHLFTAESTFVESYTQFRKKIKEVKAREEAIQEQRQKVKTAHTKLESAAKAQKPIDALKIDYEAQGEELKKMIADHEGLKRADIRDAFKMQFEAYAALAIKMSVVAKYGVYLADQIPQGSLAPGQEMPPYIGHSVTSQIVADFEKDLEANILMIPAPAPPPAPTPTPTPGPRS
ncbi:hypothetical protein HDU76_010712, partial [Blyttiomyces sp. JEL0837]